MFEVVVALGLVLMLAASLALYIRGRHQRAELARLRAQVETTTNMVTVLAGSSIPRQRAPDTPARRRGHLRLIRGGLTALTGAAMGWLWGHRRAAIAAALAAGAGLAAGLALSSGPVPSQDGRPPATDPPAAEPATPDPRGATIRVAQPAREQPVEERRKPVHGSRDGTRGEPTRSPTPGPTIEPTPSPTPMEDPRECRFELGLGDLELCVGRAS